VYNKSSFQTCVFATQTLCSWFISGFFGDAVSKSEYMAWSDKIIRELRHSWKLIRRNSQRRTILLSSSMYKAAISEMYLVQIPGLFGHMDTIKTHTALPFTLKTNLIAQSHCCRTDTQRSYCTFNNTHIAAAMNTCRRSNQNKKEREGEYLPPTLSLLTMKWKLNSHIHRFISGCIHPVNWRRRGYLQLVLYWLWNWLEKANFVKLTSLYKVLFFCVIKHKAVKIGWEGNNISKLSNFSAVLR
jgi:hypothetical protein